MKVRHVRLTPALAQGEPHAKPNSTANSCHNRDMLHLVAGERPAAARSFVIAHLDAQRTQLDLGSFFRAGHVTGQTADQQANHQESKQVGSPRHSVYAASAASFLPLSTASSMVPTM